MIRPSAITTVDDARRAARRRLPASVFAYFESSNDNDGATLRDNRRAFAEVGFRPRAAALHRDRALETTVLGHRLAVPVVLAPAGFLRLAHRDGEVGAARAAGAFGTAIGVSTFASAPIEAVAASARGPVWYQLYFAGGRTAAELSIERARAAGCTVLVLTVDLTGSAPLATGRARPMKVDLRTALRYAPEMVVRPGWLVDFMRAGSHLDVPNVRATADSPPMPIGEAVASLANVAPSWDDLTWIRSRWPGPIVVKGIVRGEDARRAVDAGADGVVVSNHGGNGLNGVPGSLRALPEVIEAVGDDVDVLLDGGVRSGTDVVKALALGARAVLIGRAYIWGLAAAGAAGVQRVLEILRDEIDAAIALLGCGSVDELDASFLDLPTSWPRRTAAL